MILRSSFCIKLSMESNNKAFETTGDTMYIHLYVPARLLYQHGRLGGAYLRGTVALEEVYNKPNHALHSNNLCIHVFIHTQIYSIAEAVDDTGSNNVVDNSTGFGSAYVVPCISTC